MKQETVYRFEVWDRETRTSSTAAQMGTRAAIRRLRGEADLDSAKTVDCADVDTDGFYSESPEQTACDGSTETQCNILAGT
jgi:hypothetical protein